MTTGVVGMTRGWVGRVELRESWSDPYERYPVLVNTQLHHSDRTDLALDENSEPFLGH